MISRLVLKDFRNYIDFDLQLKSRVNVFVGENGQGKTNILESIYFLSMLRSFRTSQVRDIKRLGSNGFYIGAKIDTGLGWQKQLEVEYFNTRKLKVDNNPVGRASEFIRQIRAVAFSPEDISIVTGNSGLRRRFIDMMIATLIPGYLSALQNYQTALKSRNALLRSHKADENTIKAYETILAQNGVVITKYRQEYIKILSDEIRTLLNGFKDGDINFTIRYKVQSGSTNEEAYLKRLDSDRKKDMHRGQTSFGPQIDDFDIFFNSKLLRSFGSTGQCRLISLCMKMAKVNIFSASQDSNDSLVVLVDDVTGELDMQTKSSFYQVINKAEQAFFTFTEEPHDDYFSDADTFHIKSGTLVDGH